MNDQEHAFVFGTSEEIMSKKYTELSSDQTILAGDEYFGGGEWIAVHDTCIGSDVGSLKVRRRISVHQNNTTSYRTKSPHECVCPGDQYCHVAHGWIPVPEESLGKCVGFTQVREPFQNPPVDEAFNRYCDTHLLPGDQPIDRLKELEIERGKVYGDPRKSHANIGLSWTGLLQQHYNITLDHPIPDYLVAKMMVAFKNQRSVRVYHQDSGDDLRVYQDFADRFQQGKE